MDWLLFNVLVPGFAFLALWSEFQRVRYRLARCTIKDSEGPGGRRIVWSQFWGRKR